MPPTAVPGQPIWVELFTSDTDAAARFYAGLFGWTHEVASAEFGGYVTFLRDGERVGGCMFNDGTQGTADNWGIYLESNDVAATASMAEAHGGQVVVEPIQVGEMGHMAMVTDPGGALVGIWQPGDNTGIAAIGETGAPGWFEVLSTSYDAVVQFYENVFGWVTHPMSDTPELRYTTLGRDEDALAGIQDARGFLDEGGSIWQHYVMVEDTDAAIAAAVSLGGAQLEAAQDSPYGRLARLADPTGAAFHVMGPNSEAD